ncbi:murein L,D-transpeptidase [Litoribrevibacter euphylliae]|uniref:Murein L,D-transpeptidase n=1 Tax=Litoribrevibacter euphylliae TaxID=1834034 RepID=A0ABV7HM69_9GAMM
MHPGALISCVLVLCTSAFAFALSAATQIKPVLPSNVAEKYLSTLLTDYQEKFQYSALQQPRRVEQFYHRMNHQTIWFDHYQLTSAGEALIQAIKENAVDQPGDYPYHAEHILYRLQSLQTHPREVTHLDVLMTDAFLSYANDVLSGDLIPNQNEPDHPAILKTASSNNDDMLVPFRSSNADTHTETNALLENTLNRDQLLPLIKHTLTPQHQGYIKLRKALDHYLKLAQTGSWEAFENTDNIKMGDHHIQVTRLKERLALLGDFFNHNFQMIPARDFLNEAARDFNTPMNFPGNQWQAHQDYFDADLSEALKQFQQRHGLHPNGVLDNATREQLNITPDQRIRQIAINMKRWRYLPSELGNRYVMANIADYSLKVINDDKTTLEMDIIVGKASRRTPILVQSIRTLVLNPSWAIPPRIARTSILPHAKRDPSYLKKHNIELVRGTGPQRTVIDPETLDWETINIYKFPYRLEQKPGRRNSLGEVKFPLNNDFAIYLHDTSQPKLFDRSMKALSSGCVRVSKPRELTAALLEDNPGWDKKRIARAHRSKRTMYLGLKQETPVYLMYWTAWVDDQGMIQFREDIYNRDHHTDYDTYASTISM